MKKLLLSIVVTACLFFVFDRLLGFGLQYLYVRSNATDEYKVSYANEMTCDPVLFMGSSRSLHHYVPSIFEGRLGQGCFNAADWGIKNIYYQYGLLSNILSRYTPQLIVLEVHPCDWLQYPLSGKERAGSLAPYCGMSEGCDEMLRLTGKYWPYRLSHVYRYAGSLPNLVAGRLGTMDRKLKGWKPLDGAFDTATLQTEGFDFAVDEERLLLLERFIEKCQEHGIRLILAVSPMYSCSAKDVFATPRQLAEKHGIGFLDHYRDERFVGHEELFFDFGHLNRKGAELYSSIVAEELSAL